MKTLVNRITPVVVFLLFAISSYAKQETTVIMKNGSKITGDITVQRPGNDITVSATKAILAIKDTDIKSKKTNKTRYEDLTRKWKRWALESKSLKGNADGRYLVMNDIVTSNYIYNNVVSTGKSNATTNTYLQVEPTTFTIKWNDILEIKRTAPSAGKTTGIDDEVVTKTGNIYKGTIVSQKIGKALSIKTRNATIDISMGNIREIRKVAREQSQPLFQQADFTNTLLMNDETTKEGIMTVQHYGTKSKDQYVVLSYKDGKTEKIQTSDVEEYRTSYNGREDKTYVPGKVYANEFAIHRAKTVTENGMTAYVDKKVFPFPEGIVTTFKAAGSKFQERWYLVALDRVELSNGTETQGYTAETRQANSISPSNTDISGGVGSISFTYLSPGFYALVNDYDNETYIIKIVK